MRTCALFLLLSVCSFAQAVFPGRAATNQDLGVVTDQGQSSLTGAISASALTIPVANGNAFQAFNIPVIEGEKILVCSASPSALTVCPGGRGYDGTIAAPHAIGRQIFNLNHSTYLNKSRLEVEALEAVWFAGGDVTIVGGVPRITRATPFYSSGFTGQSTVAVPAGLHQQGCAVIAAAYDSAGQAILGGITVDVSCNVTFTFSSPQTGSYVIIGGGGTGVSTNAVQLQSQNVDNTPPTTNQVLLYNGTNWLPTSIDSSLLVDLSIFVRTNASATFGNFTYDFSGAAHTLPAKKGLTANKPATCTTGEEYFSTDATAGQNKFFCTATNTWTQQSGGGGGGVSAVTGTGSIVSSGGATPNISCPNCVTVVSGTANQISSSGGTNPLLSLPNVLNVGIPGILSKLSLYGNTSGTVTIQPQAVAGTPVLTLPSVTGTLADGASSPLVLSATTGNLTCPTCNTSAGALTNNQLLKGGGLQAIQTGDLSGDVTTSGSMATTVLKVNGTTVPTNAAADQTPITTAAAVTAWTGIPSCLDSAGQHLNYNTSTHAFSCGTSGGTAGSAAFNTVTTGTNASATMTCGTGCAITTSGSGTNTANAFSGTLAAANLPNPSASTLGGIQSLAAVGSKWINTISTSGVPSATQPAFTDISGTLAAAQLPNPSASTLGGIQSLASVGSKWINTISTSGVPSATQPAFTDVSGSVAAGQMPALTGDATSSAGSVATTVGKINGTSLAGLATGLLKNTTGTGVPSIATASDFSTGFNCSAASASSTTYTCSTTPSFTPASGDSINFKSDVANTGSATLNVNGAGAKTIRKQAGSSNLIANDLLTGSWQILTYDGTNWQYQGLLGNSGAGSGTVNTGTANQFAFYAGGGTAVSGTPGLTDDGTTITSSRKILANGDILCNSARPCVDVVAQGADPTGVAASDAAFAAAHNAFNGLNGGTIVGCGIFKLNATWVITNPGLKIESNCGTGGSTFNSPTQYGGFKIISGSTGTETVPNPTAPVTLICSASGGSLAAATYHIHITFRNGFGETTGGGQDAQCTTTGTTSSIKIQQVTYTDGGFAYNVYASNDGVNYWLQPQGNFVGSGTLTGPPFLVTSASSSGFMIPTLSSFTGSGTAEPVSNTTSHALVLMQVGTPTTNVSAGPDIRGLYFKDTGKLGAGLVILNAQNTTLWKISADGFTANGTGMGGATPYEQGGIAIVDLNGGSGATATTNFTTIYQPEIYKNTLGMLACSSDAFMFGGDFTSTDNQVAMDYPCGNIHVSKTHFNTSDGGGGGPLTLIAARGNFSGGHFAGDFDIKTEAQNSMQGPSIKMQLMNAMRINLTCTGAMSDAAHACITLDNFSNGNFLQIDNLTTQVPFSDGTTTYKDPAGTNEVIYSGNSPGISLGQKVHLGQAIAQGDLAGVRTCASGTFVATFARAYTSTPTIVVSDETTAGGARVSAKSNTGFTVTCTGASDVFDYITMGNPN